MPARKKTTTIKKSTKKKKAMTPWMKHLMAHKKAYPHISLGDAMKQAAKTYKKDS